VFDKDYRPNTCGMRKAQNAATATRDSVTLAKVSACYHRGLQNQRPLPKMAGRATEPPPVTPPSPMTPQFPRGWEADAGSVALRTR